MFDEVVDGAESVGLDDVERARVVRFAADTVVADVDVARRAWLVVSHRQHIRPAVCIVHTINTHTHTHTHSAIVTIITLTTAEWLACWTQAQKSLGSNRSHDAVE